MFAEILTHQFFMSPVDNHTLASDFYIKRITVPTQIESEDEAQMINTIASTTQNSLIVSFLIPFIFMLFAKVSMDRVWALYYML